jgi:hypothetical protein
MEINKMVVNNTVQIITRNNKGSELTFEEMDKNLITLGFLGFRDNFIDNFGSSASSVFDNLTDTLYNHDNFSDLNHENVIYGNNGWFHGLIAPCGFVNVYDLHFISNSEWILNVYGVKNNIITFITDDNEGLDVEGDEIYRYSFDGDFDSILIIGNLNSSQFSFVKSVQED